MIVCRDSNPVVLVHCWHIATKSLYMYIIIMDNDNLNIFILIFILKMAKISGDSGK